MGLRINLPKNCLVGVGMVADDVHVIASLLGCQISNLPTRYLGLQLGGRGVDFVISIARMEFWTQFKIVGNVVVRVPFHEWQTDSYPVNVEFYPNLSNVSEGLTEGGKA